MRVILAEKPDMGVKIAEALGIQKRENGFIVLNNGDKVTWAIGHLFGLKKPDGYDKFQDWSLNTLPIIPDSWELEIDQKKKTQFQVIKDLTKSCSEVVLATDPGREGELIGRWIIKMTGYRGVLKRLWIDDLTPGTIQKGFQNLLDGNEKFNLYQAAELRAKADYIIGFTSTRFFTLVARDITNEGTLLSSGRVQTPTLKIVYDREMEIAHFTPEPFFELECEFDTNKGKYKGKYFKVIDGERKFRFKAKDEAIHIQEHVKGKRGIITEYDEKVVHRNAPHLFDTTSLKTAARKSLGYGVEETSKLAQSLYDKGYITYTRTASVHLSENAADQLVENLQAIRESSKYKHLFPDQIVSLKGNKRFVDTSKAVEHHAIVPTGMNPTDLPDKEEKLYELILRRTLAAFYPSGKDREVTVITKVENDEFYSKGVTVIDEGWRRLFQNIQHDEEKEDIQKLPHLENGLPSKVIHSSIREGKTTPPKRLTEDELEKAMKNAGKFLSDDQDQDEIYQLLKDKGIGTEATRTQIILTLKDVGYIETKKNLIYLTSKGKHFIEAIKDHPLTSVELTGEWEKRLKEIEQGKRDPNLVLNEFIEFAKYIVSANQKEKISNNIRSLQASNENVFTEEKNVIGQCPLCNKDVVEQKNFYGCSGYKERCKFTLPKKYLGTTLTNQIVKNLVAYKKVLLKGLKGKYGVYDLFVYLDQNGNLTKDKPTLEQRSLGKCPLCRNPVLEREKFYGCSGYKEGCNFYVSKVIAGKKISSAQVQRLLEKGKTDLIKGFQGKSPFNARLKYDLEQKKVVFEFDNSKDLEFRMK